MQCLDHFIEAWLLARLLSQVVFNQHCSKKSHLLTRSAIAPWRKLTLDPPPPPPLGMPVLLPPPPPLMPPLAPPASPLLTLGIWSYGWKLGSFGFWLEYESLNWQEKTLTMAGYMLRSRVSTLVPLLSGRPLVHLWMKTREERMVIQIRRKKWEWSRHTRPDGWSRGPLVSLAFWPGSFPV